MFKFLRDKFYSQAPFTFKEYAEVAGISERSAEAHMRAQNRKFLIKGPEGSYSVSFVFGKFNTWPKFRDRVAYPSGNLIRKYTYSTDQVVIFDFYMPLSNEECLRHTLDALFYEDTIKFRAGFIEPRSLSKHFPKNRNEKDNKGQLDRFCSFVANQIYGYSIYHVNGRFRVDDLMTQKVGKVADRYLVDETTAVVRFILPCEGDNRRASEKVATRTRWCFHELFVKAVLELVDGEDQVWLLESGMEQRLHRWSAQEPLLSPGGYPRKDQTPVHVIQSKPSDGFA